MSEKMVALNLGWGVQSFTMAVMVALGELPKPDIIIHSDTQYEKEGTYRFAEWGAQWLAERGLSVVTVTAQHDEEKRRNDPPWFTGEGGMLSRQCTHRWKIQPIDKHIRGIHPTWEKWIGITLDEWQRVKSPTAKWYTFRYPLLDKRMSRLDCVTYLKSKGLPVPPKSSCKFCPYHSKKEWAAVKERPEDWESAIRMDSMIRGISPHGAYIHPSRIPLELAVKTPRDEGFFQLELCDSEGGCFL